MTNQIDLAATKRITSAIVREMCGGVSDMTLWRWLEAEALDFPKPIHINRRRYWKAVEIQAWLDDRQKTAA